MPPKAPPAPPAPAAPPAAPPTVPQQSLSEPQLSAHATRGRTSSMNSAHMIHQTHFHPFVILFASLLPGPTVAGPERAGKTSPASAATPRPPPPRPPPPKPPQPPQTPEDHVGKHIAHQSSHSQPHQSRNLSHEGDPASRQSADQPVAPSAEENDDTGDDQRVNPTLIGSGKQQRDNQGCQDEPPGSHEPTSEFAPALGVAPAFLLKRRDQGGPRPP